MFALVAGILDADRPRSTVGARAAEHDIAARVQHRPDRRPERPAEGPPRPAQREPLADPAEVDGRPELDPVTPPVDPQPAGVHVERRAPAIGAGPASGAGPAGHFRRPVRGLRHAHRPEALEVGQHPRIEPAGRPPARPIGGHERPTQPAVDVDPMGQAGLPAGRTVRPGQVARLAVARQRLLRGLDLRIDDRPGPEGLCVGRPDERESKRRAHRSPFEPGDPGVPADPGRSVRQPSVQINGRKPSSSRGRWACSPAGSPTPTRAGSRSRTGGRPTSHGSWRRSRRAS